MSFLSSLSAAAIHTHISYFTTSSPPKVDIWKVYLDVRAGPAIRAVGETRQLLVVELEVYSFQEPRDHVHSLLVAWRSDEDTAVKSPKHGNIHVIWTSNPRPMGDGGCS